MRQHYGLHFIFLLTHCFGTILHADDTEPSLTNQTIQEKIESARQSIDDSYDADFSTLSAWLGTTLPAFLYTSFRAGKEWRADSPHKWSQLRDGVLFTGILTAISITNAKAWGYLLPMGGWSSWNYFGRFCNVNLPAWMFSVFVVITKYIDNRINQGGKYRGGLHEE